MKPISLTSPLGDSQALSIPLFKDGVAFAPGAEWVLIFTAKRKATDPDPDAVFQKKTGIGITHSDTSALVDVVPNDSEALDPCLLVWDIQAQRISDGAVKTVAGGSLRFTRDITRLLEVSLTIYTSQPPVPGGGGGGEVTLAAIAAAFGLDSISINSNFEFVIVKNGVEGFLTFSAR